MPPPKRLLRRIGVVTGADSAAGRDVARTLAAEGMSLMLIARPGCQVRDLAEDLSASHDVRCFPAALDVTDPAAVDRIVMHAEQHLGTVDVLVNTVPGRITDALLPTMEQRGRGHIVNVPPAPPESAAAAGVTVVNLPASTADQVARAVVGAVLGDPT